MKRFTDAENIAWEQTLPSKIMSACLAIRHNGTVLMVKASYKDYWSLPGGVIDENESPLAAAIRETYEETGVTINPDDCTPLGITYVGPKNGHRDRVSFAFVTDASSSDFNFAVPNEEIDDIAWVSLSEASAMANGHPTYHKLQGPLSGVPSDFYTELL